jgi:subtilisin family serine protease
MPYTVHDRGDSTIVVPADARSMLRGGALDERLFRVDYLVDNGYGDAERDDLPLVITGGNNAEVATMLQEDGATVRTTLDSVNGVAVDVDTADRVVFWESISTAGQEAHGPRAVVSTVEKVWLDGRVEATLDHSVPQIGAPIAWRQGLDGDGVTVAVLDTGIDDDHPDLRDQVVAAQNFSESDDYRDRVGHGTHVAATIAGTGAASSRPRPMPPLSSET